MTRYILHREAEAELVEAATYYEERRNGLGGEFGRAFAETVARIRKFPAAFRSDEDGLKHARFRRFPYSIIFLEQDDAFWFAAIAHDKRRPGYWAKRKPGDQ